jgi:hypothetical protein
VRARATRAAIAAALLLVALPGCGVGLQESAEPLPAGALPTVTPTASQPARARTTVIHFVNGRALEGVERQIVDRSANGVMAALAAGPPVDRGELRTLALDLVTGAPVFEVVSVSAFGEVVLRRSDVFQTMPAQDQVLLTGQIVLSMDEVGLSRVIVVDATGVPVPVTLPDGRVAEGPLTASEYDDLLVS